MSYELLSKRVIAFVGPSGSGKDTLMVKARDYLISSGHKIHIVRRWITRPNDNTEQFISVDRDSFDNKIRENKFVLHWEIYGNQYGIPREEIENFLNLGFTILVNLSRGKLREFKLKYPNFKIVVIDISKQLAKERIQIRKRDTGKNLQARLNRFDQKINIPFPDLIIKNEGKMEVILSILIAFISTVSIQ